MATPDEKIEQLELGIVRYNDGNGFRWYEIGGAKYVSVTTVLDCFVPPQLKNWMIRNSAKSIEKKKQDTASIGSQIHANVHAGSDERFNSLAKDSGFKTIKSEFVVKSKLGFAGQVDRLIELAETKYIIDVKTGRFGATAGAQMAAYLLAANEAGEDVRGIGVVSIPRDGSNPGWFDYSKNLENCQYAFLCAFEYWKFQNYKKLIGWEFQSFKTPHEFQWSFNNRSE